MKHLDISCNMRYETRVTKEGLSEWLAEWFNGRRDEADFLRLTPANYYQPNLWKDVAELKALGLPWNDDWLISRNGLFFVLIRV